MPWLLYPEERDLVPIVYNGGWAPGPVWMGVEYLTATGIQSLDCPARSKPLYQVDYPGPPARQY